MELDHVGIAVPSLTEAQLQWEPLVGGRATAPELIESQRVRVCFVEVGPLHLEFLEPTEAQSPVGRFLADRGGGLHHVAFRVPDVDAMLRALAGQGYRLVDRVARPGARGRRVGFVHPKSTGGALVEFVEGP